MTSYHYYFSIFRSLFLFTLLLSLFSFTDVDADETTAKSPFYAVYDFDDNLIMQNDTIIVFCKKDYQKIKDFLQKAPFHQQALLDSAYNLFYKEQKNFFQIDLQKNLITPADHNLLINEHLPCDQSAPNDSNYSIFLQIRYWENFFKLERTSISEIEANHSMLGEGLLRPYSFYAQMNDDLLDLALDQHALLGPMAKSFQKFYHVSNNYILTSRGQSPSAIVNQIKKNILPQASTENITLFCLSNEQIENMARKHFNNPYLSIDFLQEKYSHLKAKIMIEIFHKALNDRPFIIENSRITHPCTQEVGHFKILEYSDDTNNFIETVNADLNREIVKNKNALQDMIVITHLTTNNNVKSFALCGKKTLTIKKQDMIKIEKYKKG